MGTAPSATHCSSARASATVRMRLSRSTGTETTASGPRPRSLADFCTLKWLHSEVKIRSRVKCSGRIFASSRASSRAWRLDWVPPLVKIPSAAGPSPIRSVVQSISRLLDEGAARALVPGVQGGVDRGEHGLAEHGGYDDGAVEVPQVAGVVEVDGVAEVDLAQLVQGGGGIAQRPVEVDRVDDGGELVDTDPAEGAIGGGERGRYPFHACGDGAPIVLRSRVVEQVRTHKGVLPGEGNFIAALRAGRGTRARCRSKVSLT